LSRISGHDVKIGAMFFVLTLRCPKNVVALVVIKHACLRIYLGRIWQLNLDSGGLAIIFLPEIKSCNNEKLKVVFVIAVLIGIMMLATLIVVV
jgi:hypothetical protein